jgi:hypothetical protein
MEAPNTSGLMMLANTPIGKVLFSAPNTIKRLDTNIYVYEEDQDRIYGIKTSFPIWNFALIKWITENIFYIYTSDSLNNENMYLFNINSEAIIIKKLPLSSFYTYAGIYPPLKLVVKWDSSDTSWRVYKYTLDSSYNIIPVEVIGNKIVHPVKEGWWPPAFISETKYWVFFIIYNLFYKRGKYFNWRQ